MFSLSFSPSSSDSLSMLLRKSFSFLIYFIPFILVSPPLLPLSLSPSPYFQNMYHFLSFSFSFSAILYQCLVLVLNFSSLSLTKVQYNRLGERIYKWDVLLNLASCCQAKGENRINLKLQFLKRCNFLRSLNLILLKYYPKVPSFHFELMCILISQSLILPRAQNNFSLLDSVFGHSLCSLVKVAVYFLPFTAVGLSSFPFTVSMLSNLFWIGLIYFFSLQE